MFLRLHTALKRKEHVQQSGRSAHEKCFVSLIQLPNGVTQNQAMYQDRFGKLQEHLRQLTLLFRKLRLLYERCVEMTSDLQEAPAEVRKEPKNAPLFSYCS